jgi:hypothetical protein
MWNGGLLSGRSGYIRFDNGGAVLVKLSPHEARWTNFTPMSFQPRGEAMKLLALFGLLAGSMLLTTATGCATPGYSAEERNQQITRNQDYEFKQLVDDWDHIWLLRPASSLTTWNVQ